MKIKKVSYQNFRNFKEYGSIDFSTDGRVNIIYGINGAGKTTFHQLFQWIIYGQVRFNKTTSDKLFNLDLEDKAELNSQFNVLGIIDFEHNGKDFSMRRESIYKKQIKDSVVLQNTFTITKKTENNDWMRISNPDDFIEQILPSGLADYFFFDGESMITDLKSKGKDSAKSLKEALYLILDLSIYDKAVKYIGNEDQKTTVLGSLFLNKTGMGSSAELITEGQKMESAQSRRDDLQNNLDTLENKITEKEELIKSISEKIGAAKSQKEYDEQRNQCKKIRDNYLNLANREYSLYGEEMIASFPKFFLSTVIEKASRRIKRQSNNNKLINGVNKPLIDALINEDKCLCGNSLNHEEKEILKRLYNLLPPLGYESLYLNFRDMASRWGKEYNREKIENYIKNVSYYLDSARKEDHKISKIDEKMKEDKKSEHLVDERIKLENEIIDLKEKSKECYGNLNNAKILVRKHKKKIDDLSEKEESNKIIEQKIHVMNCVKTYFNKILREKSEVYSSKLENTIQDLLDQMLEAKRKVEVTNDFALRVYDSYEDESKSEGQFATVTFAYIGGIFKVLKEEDILQNKEYPLILDAPFSKLGDLPRQKVINTIPAYAPQIILFSKDNLQDCFGDSHIGKVYTIVSNAEQNIATVEEGLLWK